MDQLLVLHNGIHVEFRIIWLSISKETSELWRKSRNSKIITILTWGVDTSPDGVTDTDFRYKGFSLIYLRNSISNGNTFIKMPPLVIIVLNDFIFIVHIYFIIWTLLWYMRHVISNFDHTSMSPWCFGLRLLTLTSTICLFLIVIQVNYCHKLNKSTVDPRIRFYKTPFCCVAETW